MVAPNKSMPPRTRWAIDRLIKAAKSEGFGHVQVGFKFGTSTIGDALLVDFDGDKSFFWLDDGEWYQKVEVV